MKLGQVEVSSNISQITRLAYRKSYLAIIGPDSHEYFTNYEINYSYYLLQSQIVLAKGLCVNNLNIDFYQCGEWADFLILI